MNFLMFVASAHGLLADEFGEGTWPGGQFSNGGRSNEKFKGQWNELWKQCVYNKGLIKSGVQRRLILDPPEFSMVDKDVRAVLIHMWPSFIKWWNMPAGGQAAMHYWEGAPNLLSFVQEFESQVGRKIKPFKLDIDLVYTGLREPIEVNEQFMIMPVKIDYLLNRNWWMKRFEERY